MKKLLVFLVLATLVSCGRPKEKTDFTSEELELINGYTENGISWNKESFPLTFYVPEQFYDRFKKEFDITEDKYTSASGKPLVYFEPMIENPKYENTWAAYVDSKEQGKLMILFRENNTEFGNVSWGGAAYLPGGGQWTTIFINHTNYKSSSTFLSTLLHEMGHGVGFHHTDCLCHASIMGGAGLFTSYDRERLSEKYPFSLILATTKDLEGMGAKVEAMEVADMEDMLVNYGLSTDRAEKLGKLMVSYNSIKNKRALTAREKDVFTKELTGMSFEKATEVLVEEGYDALVEKASEVNGADPEAIKELLNEVM